MTKRIFLAILALAVAGCGGGSNPVTGGGSGGGNPTTLILPPGTTSPSPSSSVQRYEERDGTGNGYAQGITYDSGSDTFTVDNLAFDGDNAYHRSTAVPNLGPFQVYENNITFIDPVSGASIPQDTYRAVRGASTSGNTSFAVVRTGSYVNYGFGGFIYQRNAGVNIPTSGQAHYAGAYAGLRDFNQIGGLQYVSGAMTMDIDFNDFNTGSGVSGSVTNRRVFDLNGNDITAAVVAQINAEKGTSLGGLPVLNIAVGPGVIDGNGELTGNISSFIPGSSGALEAFETGKYYAVLTGDPANEVAGIIVVNAADAIGTRETGGFILYRP